ncbi:hypothetical protein [Pseudonocardia humida]|uniref:Transcriptional regulator n=1 Tax=Pseudonocardia humida TaxID=2800819 RepID=A0ABT1A297_9PSEU|nr:hypothetical protein [Pseudonocardia humida]MCO1657133.1 hypothetical protein [Pseudonocardia humida]
MASNHALITLTGALHRARNDRGIRWRWLTVSLLRVGLLDRVRFLRV